VPQPKRAAVLFRENPSTVYNLLGTSDLTKPLVINQEVDAVIANPAKSSVLQKPRVIDRPSQEALLMW
jgi:hypothetical protein